MKTKKLLDKNGNPIQIEQSQVRGLKEALANASGGASGKEIIEITTPLFNANGVDEADYQTANFDNIDLNNKYVIWDWNIAEYENLDYLQVDKYSWFTMDFTNKQPKNATLLIKMPYFEKITNDTYFSIILDENYVYLDCRALKQEEVINYEVCRYYDDELNSLVFSYNNFVSGCQFIKIDFDENGFATIYFYDYYEM